MLRLFSSLFGHFFIMATWKLCVKLLSFRLFLFLNTRLFRVMIILFEKSVDREQLSISLILFSLQLIVMPLINKTFIYWAEHFVVRC